MASTTRTVWDEHGKPHEYIAINSGHLSDTRRQLYVSEPDWQTGFTILEYWTEAGKQRYTPHVVPIVDGAFRFAGKVYRG
jgi:hypothetical protein